MSRYRHNYNIWSVNEQTRAAQGHVTRFSHPVYRHLQCKHKGRVLGYDAYGNDGIVWHPTPIPTVMDMLVMADVKPTDTLMDLGSGDGRIVILAASMFGCKAIGIDKDKRMLSAARTNARAAGMYDKVEFRDQNIYDTDLREATVITCFLYNTFMDRLFPKFMLLPGRRIVSHYYRLKKLVPTKEINPWKGQGLYNHHPVALYHIPG